jgi:hypothetical protein
MTPFTWETAEKHKCVVNRKLGQNGAVANYPSGDKIGFCQHCNYIIYFQK